MKIKRNIIIIAVGLALFTTILLYFYLNKVEQANIINYSTQNVVVATMDIPADTRVTSAMIEIRKIATDAVHPEALKNFDDVVGYITKDRIIQGEQLLNSRIDQGVTEIDLAYKVPDNMRAMTISTNETTSVGGYLTPGSRVDILVSYQQGVNITTYTQLQNIVVLAKGTNALLNGEANPNGDKSVTSSITLLVTPDQAQVLAYAIINGTINLTLRNPADQAKVNLSDYGTTNFGSWRER